MSLFFFQKYWNIVGDDVIEAMLSALSSSHMFHKMNYTHIVLFPKINELKNVADFRPISLSYVVSRIISSLGQSAKTNLVQCNFQITRCFAPNRLSTDNTTVAFEILHRM